MGDMYLISMRTIADSLLNKNPASALQSSVLPTPVGPKNRKEPSGRLGLCSPARAMRTTLLVSCQRRKWEDECI